MQAQAERGGCGVGEKDLEDGAEAEKDYGGALEVLGVDRSSVRLAAGVGPHKVPQRLGGLVHPEGGAPGAKYGWRKDAT